MENTRPENFTAEDPQIKPVYAIALFVLVLLLHAMLLSLFFLSTGTAARENIHYINIETLGRALNNPAPQSSAEHQDKTARTARRTPQPPAEVERDNQPASLARTHQHGSNASDPTSTDAPAGQTQAAGATAAAHPAEAIASADTAIAYLLTRQPPYPERARMNREEGRVVLRVNVDPGGAVAGLAVTQSSGYPELDQSALDTVRTWRFRPARHGNTAIAATVRVPVSFHLQEQR